MQHIRKLGPAAAALQPIAEIDPAIALDRSEIFFVAAIRPSGDDHGDAGLCLK
jgi:hypothetical protein